MATYSYAPPPSSPGPGVRPGEQLGMAQSSPYKFDPPASRGESAQGRPIDFLRPQSPQHAFVLDYLLRRLQWSEQRMGQFYGRWQAAELRHQAYVTLPQYERIVKETVDSGVTPAPEEIVVPYAWATHQTILTYMLMTFAARKPLHQVGAYRGEQVRRAKNMETLLQYNADYQRYVFHLSQFISNGELYGLAVERDMWTRIERERTVTRPPDPGTSALMAQMGMQAQPRRTQERAVCFEGNAISVISPFMFFPDPRVPMVEVAEKGEFVFWRSYEGRHQLLREEANGTLKWVKNASTSVASPWNDNGAQSMSAMRTLGASLTGGGSPMWGEGIDNYQVDQGTIEIIPSELGLGPDTRPQKWLFTILNKTQIIQAEPIQLNHGRHPVSVAEPNMFGHSFGSLSTTDMVGPLQDLMTWLVNSHMFNVRAALNNFILVNPSMVEMDDLLDPKPGGLIRMKSSPWGQPDPRMAMQQFPIADITRSHLSDFQMLQQLGGDLTGANDIMRGRSRGGRRSATEARMEGEAGGSRLAARAMLYSAQAITPSAEMRALNYQQYLSQEWEFRVLGALGQESSVRISPQEIEGDFFFPIHDGNMPLDRVALLDVMRQAWQAIIADPSGQMQKEYNASALFRWMAQTAGIQNLDEFRTTAAAPGAIQDQAQAGNLVPLSEVPGAMAQIAGGPSQSTLVPAPNPQALA